MLPPGLAEPPAIQTARWLLRPISFLESCRRRHGELFSVRFLGFRTPMVMTSDPAAIRALYTDRRHGLPPGRGVALLPVVGPRSVLLLEGSEHLARRKLMLPPFHGERMRAYEATVREVVERDVAVQAAVRLHARAPARGARPAGEAAPAAGGDRRAAAGGDRRAAGDGRRRGHPVAAPGRALRGRRADGRPGGLRPARDAAGGRARDDGDRAGVDARAARPPPERA